MYENDGPFCYSYKILSFFTTGSKCDSYYIFLSCRYPNKQCGYVNQNVGTVNY